MYAPTLVYMYSIYYNRSHKIKKEISHMKFNNIEHNIFELFTPSKEDSPIGNQ